MTDSKRFIVLETKDQAAALTDFLEWLSLSQPELGIKTVDHRASANIVYLLVRDLVDELLAHKLHNPENTEVVASIVFGVPKNKLTPALEQQFNQITGTPTWYSIITNLRKQLEATIKKGTWTDWTVVKVGYLTGIAEGEDHRITEFHRETKALATDDEAVLTLNCTNPINYLYNEFSKRYGANFTSLVRQLNDPNVKITAFDRKVLTSFIADPTEYIVGLFLDTLVYVHPQVELSKNAYSRSLFIERALGIYDMSSFQTNVIQKLIMAFGMNWFSHDIKKDENYYVEYYLGTHILAVFKKPFSNITERYEAELLMAFNRGDYLPPEERALAERLFIESPQLVLNSVV